jgi:predicted transcriptional regulator of viral defense system
MRAEVLELLDDLAADGRKRLTSAQVRERLAISPQAASNLLSRLVRDGYLDRVAPGAYAPRPLGMLGTRAASQDPALAVAAAFGAEPHRIAYRSALDHHGLLSHPVRTLQVAFPRRVKVREVSGRRLQAIFEPHDTIDLAAVDTGRGARVSSVERALLECAHRSGLAGGWTTLAAAVGDGSWDPDRLVALANRLGLAAALRRIGSLAERHGQTDRAAALPLPDAEARTVDLDPRQPADDPWVDPRWRVRWPSATVTRLIERGVEASRGRTAPRFVGAGEGPDDLGRVAERYLTDLVSAR